MKNICVNNIRDNRLWRCGLHAITNFQFAMLARIDDTTQVLLDSIQIHDNSCNVLKTRKNWSKNVQDERDAPFQIDLGCMDTLYCVLTGLALWLELQFRMNPKNALLSPYVFAFNDDTRIPEEGLKSKQIASECPRWDR